MIESIFCFGNGNVVATDGKEQLPKESANAFLVVLQSKLRRGVINDKTVVNLTGWRNPNHPDGYFTVAELIEMGRLKRTKAIARTKRQKPGRAR